MADETPARSRTSAVRPDARDAVSIDAVTKSFGATRAVDDVSFTVPAGSVHGLLGPNGAGKTTLLRMIFGLVRPDAGTVRVLGRSPFGAPGAALHGLAGFVESPRFYPYLTATRNLDLLSALDGPEAGSRVDAVLEAVGLAERAAQKVGGYSTGMKQRLGIAAALLRDPHLLVLDEPTNGLDPTGTRDLHELIRAVAASGRTVLLSSHDMAEVESLCDSVTVLRRGRRVITGTLDRLRADAPAPTFCIGTADDAAAATVAATTAASSSAGVRVEPTPDGLVVHAEASAMDSYVLALGRAGIAVRSLARRDTALEALFLRLTADDTDDTDDGSA